MVWKMNWVSQSHKFIFWTTITFEVAQKKVQVIDQDQAESESFPHCILHTAITNPLTCSLRYYVTLKFYQ